MFSNFFPEIWPLFINVEKCGRQQTGDRREYKTAHGLVCLITNATDTHSEYVILIASSRVQCLC